MAFGAAGYPPLVRSASRERVPPAVAAQAQLAQVRELRPWTRDQDDLVATCLSSLLFSMIFQCFFDFSLNFACFF